MSILNIDELLQERDPAEPCGPNLEYDPVYLELEQVVVGKPEVQYGDTVTPAVPPEWKTVKKLALSLMARSQDLRVAMALLRSLIALHGMAGAVDGLTLLKRLMEERWDFVHPQLDPDDDLDPMLRINSLATLADSSTIIKELKEAPFIMLPGLGPLTLRDLEIASGELQVPDGQEKKSITSIDASINDIAIEQLTTAYELQQQAYDNTVQLEANLVRQVGASRTLNLDALIKSLKRGRDFLAERHSRRTGVAVGDAGDLQETDGAPAADGTPGAAPRAAAISGEISSREDVSRMIDKICAYYQKYEPSSPVPLLLLRAKWLVPKSFFEIMKELAPDGLKQVSVITGTQSEE